jgi:hypothetical protein
LNATDVQTAHTANTAHAAYSTYSTNTANTTNTHTRSSYTHAAPHRIIPQSRGIEARQTISGNICVSTTRTQAVQLLL